MAAPPLKAMREQCYTARDAHYKCIDENSDVSKCTKTLDKLEEMCPKVWVKHFERTRQAVALKQIREGQTFEP